MEVSESTVHRVVHLRRFPSWLLIMLENMPIFTHLEISAEIPACGEVHHDAAIDVIPVTLQLLSDESDASEVITNRRLCMMHVANLALILEDIPSTSLSIDSLLSKDGTECDTHIFYVPRPQTAPQPVELPELPTELPVADNAEPPSEPPIREEPPAAIVEEPPAAIVEEPPAAIVEEPPAAANGEEQATDQEQQVERCDGVTLFVDDADNTLCTLLGGLPEQCLHVLAFHRTPWPGVSGEMHTLSMTNFRSRALKSILIDGMHRVDAFHDIVHGAWRYEATTVAGRRPLRAMKTRRTAANRERELALARR